MLQRTRARSGASRDAQRKRELLCWKCSDTRAGLCGRSLQRRRLPRARLPLGRLRQRSQRAPALPISTTQRQPLGLSKRRSLRCVAAAADGGGVTAVLALIVLSEARACRWAAAWILAVGSLARRDSLCPATTFLRKGSCVCVESADFGELLRVGQELFEELRGRPFGRPLGRHSLGL